MKKEIIIIYVFATINIFAQEDSLKNLLNYYPLQTGNYFEYFSRSWEYPYYNDSSATSLTILGDTVLENGEKYKILFNQNIFGSKDYYNFRRIDSLDGSVYEYRNDERLNNHEYKIDSLFAQLGDTINCSHDFTIEQIRRITILNQIVIDSVLNVVTEIRIFTDISYIPFYSYELSQGFGFKYAYNCEFSCGLSELVYANINSVEYGKKIIVSIDYVENPLSTFSLFQNYPNPFNPSTVISYQIPSSVKSEMSKVKLTIYDVLGREVTTLVNKIQSAGNYEVTWDANNYPSGIYFYTMQAGSFRETKKMILVK